LLSLKPASLSPWKYHVVVKKYETVLSRQEAKFCGPALSKEGKEEKRNLKEEKRL